MKKLIFIFVLVLAHSNANAVSLNTGDIAVVSFDSLSLVGPASPPFDTPDIGLVSITWRFSFALDFESNRSDPLGPWTLNPGELLKVELFEDSVDDAPFLDTIVDGNTSTGLSALGTNGTNNSPLQWTDFQGLVRFTMLNGFVELDNVTIGLDQDGFSYSEVFTPTIVPLPSSMALLLSSMGFMLLFKKRRGGL